MAIQLCETARHISCFAILRLSYPQLVKEFETLDSVTKNHTDRTCLIKYYIRVAFFEGAVPYPTN